MQYSYTYANFAGDVDIGQLNYEVENSSLEGLLGINTTSTHVIFEFDNELNDDSENILSSIVSSHSSANVGSSNAEILTVSETTSNSDYTLKYIYNYSGSRDKPISKIEIISNMEAGGSNYSMRIYDRTNKKIISELTGLSNTQSAINNMTSISNLSYNKSLLELHVKIVNSDINKLACVHINSMKIYF